LLFAGVPTGVQGAIRLEDAEFGLRFED
jgi:hypothetical protein